MNSALLPEKEILKIARLANLPLKASEIKKFQKQLSEALAYAAVLQELKTENQSATAQVIRSTNVTRPDEVVASLSQEEALSGSRKAYKGYFKVKSIFK